MNLKFVHQIITFEFLIVAENNLSSKSEYINLYVIRYFHKIKIYKLKFQISFNCKQQHYFNDYENFIIFVPSTS